MHIFLFFSFVNYQKNCWMCFIVTSVKIFLLWLFFMCKPIFFHKATSNHLVPREDWTRLCDNYLQTIASRGSQDIASITSIYCEVTGCNGYRRRKWTRRHEFKSWMRMIAFHIALIPLGKVWIQLFSLQLWVNSRTDCVP